MNHKRIESTTSRTAEWMCLSRAVSNQESDPLYHSDDYIAIRLLPNKIKWLLHIPFFSSFYRQVFVHTGMYEYLIARTKYIDAAFKGALTEGFDQILILGAGFDTRALRFQTESRSTHIFEVDAPVT